MCEIPGWVSVGGQAYLTTQFVCYMKPRKVWLDTYGFHRKTYLSILQIPTIHGMLLVSKVLSLFTFVVQQLHPSLSNQLSVQHIAKKELSFV